ncbi:MAG: LD-carboxypeptidase [Bacteroidales bacterium]|nr:LD-carboxypeptidase [Bacteroidales bacterium]
MISPTFLKTGDKVGVAAPAGRVIKDTIDTGMALLKDLSGFNVVTGQHLYKRQGVFAGTDRERTADLQQMLDDQEIKAIFFARGGYGCIRVLPHLDFSGFVRHPKWLIGFSDITVFHAHVNTKLKTQTIHGSMPGSYASGKYNPANLADLINLLKNKPVSYAFPSAHKNLPGTVTGEIVGGNLSIICSLLGTPFDINTKQKILLIEDVAEHDYRIDRMLNTLRLAGKLKDLKALLIGDFTNVTSGTFAMQQSIEEMIMEAATGNNYPLAFGIKAGHDLLNKPFIFGRHVKVKVEENHTNINYE